MLVGSISTNTCSAPPGDQCGGVLCQCIQTLQLVSSCKHLSSPDPVCTHVCPCCTPVHVCTPKSKQLFCCSADTVKSKGCRHCAAVYKSQHQTGQKDIGRSRRKRAEALLDGSPAAPCHPSCRTPHHINPLHSGCSYSSGMRNSLDLMMAKYCSPSSSCSFC